MTYIHKVFKDALEWTHGTVIFQEQVINIMRGLGMSIEGINTFFKIVKSSGSGAVAANIERLDQMRQEFDDLCVKAGISRDQLDEAWYLTSGFVSYGFNLAHATGYGIRSYRTAYLKTHYPLEYMTALLTAWAGRGTTKKGQPTKEVLYQREARRIGIRILPADVNISGSTWTIDKKRNAIRRGIVSIKGVGAATANNIVENAPYKDLNDLITRTDSRKCTGSKTWEKDGKLSGVLEHLRQAGALSSLGIERDDY